MTENDNSDSLENAEAIIARFGGIRPMANKMDVPVTTVQGWKKRNVIPGNRKQDVLDAAVKHRIDLSALVSDAPAVSGGFDRAMETASQDESPAAQARHEDAVLMARRSEARQDTLAQNEKILAEMKQAQSAVFVRSVWFTALFVTVVILITAVLLWPTKRQLDRNTQEIEALQQDLAAQQGEKKSFMGAMLPKDLEERFGEIQMRSRALENTIVTLSEQVETMARDVMEPNIPMSERVQRLEGHAAQMGAPEALLNMMRKVEQMKHTVEGQGQLATALRELNNIVGNAPEGEEATMEQALQLAQQDDDALGQTLQGVPVEDLKAAALLLGLAQMRETLNRNNQPFGQDLALMQKMLGENDPELQAAIAKLAPKAEGGILTPKGLQSEFRGMAGEIVVASLQGEDVSIQEKARARFNDLLSVEKDGELITGTDTQAVVARAQQMLDAGDIEGAIAELKGLEGPAAERAQPFLSEAGLTLDAYTLQDMLTEKAVNIISGGVTPQGGSALTPLIHEIKKLAPPRRVVRDEESGFVILEPKTKIIP